ncbi:MAG: trypsin-like peptidase domain-containing protein [Cyanobacteria bacterium P01_G01_bin.49]
MRNILGGVLLVTVATATVSLPLVAQPSVEVNQIGKPITVLLQTPGDSGSGVIIKREGEYYFVLTAKHVVNSINPGEEAYVTTYDSSEHVIETQTIELIPNVDLAVVSFKSTQQYPVATLGNSDNVSEGMDVYVTGFPLSTPEIPSTYTFSRGTILSILSQPINGGYRLNYDSPTRVGMSGGAVLNDEGELIGIHGRTDASIKNSPGETIKFPFNQGIPIQIYSQWTNNRDSQVVATEIQSTALPKKQQHKLVFVEFFANWCRGCHKMKGTLSLLKAAYRDRVHFVLFDRTDKASLRASKLKAKRLGVAEFLAENKSKTGTVIIFDPATGEILGKYDDDSRIEDYTKVLDSVLP